MALHTLTLGQEPLKKRLYKQIKHRLYKLADENYLPLWGGKLPRQIHIISYPGITIKLSN